MGAQPKRKPSTRRQGKRRATHRVKLPEISKCQKCGQDKLPHFACSNCGFYKRSDNEPYPKSNQSA